MSTVVGATVINPLSEFIDTSGATNPMEVDGAINISSDTSQKWSGSPIVPIAISQKTNSLPQSVAMSISQPRLTANGKRIGRPPGTFKVHKIAKKATVDDITLKVPITCKWENCYQQFHSVKEISTHLNIIHFGVESVCKWEGCHNRRFKSLYLLVSHCRSHTGERHLKCPVKDCPKAYKSRENLSTHVRTHTGEKPYECQFLNCIKRFTNASDRGKHENRCHSGKREYICDVPNCTKSYTDPSSLRKHILHIHGPEVHESRKKTKVRWMYRRDGKQLNEDGTVTVIEKPVSPKQEVEQPATAAVTGFPFFPAIPGFPLAFPGLLGIPQFASLCQAISMQSPIQQTSATVSPAVSQEGIIPEWNPSPRATLDFPNSAFRTFVPYLIKLNISVANSLSEDEMNYLTDVIIERQQFVQASYANLQKPLPIPEKYEYKECECDECRLGTNHSN